MWKVLPFSNSFWNNLFAVTVVHHCVVVTTAAIAGLISSWIAMYLE